MDFVSIETKQERRKKNEFEFVSWEIVGFIDA